MTALRERPTLLLVALLAVVGALLSYAIVASKPAGRTEQFWIYVRSRTSIPRTFDRALALEFAVIDSDATGPDVPRCGASGN